MDRLLISIVILFCFSAPAHSYKFEVDAGYVFQRSKASIEVGLSSFTTGSSLIVQERTNEFASARGTYFLSEVSNSEGPIREYAFLGKASSISVGYVANNSRTTSSIPSTFARQKSDTDTYDLSSRFILGERSWIVETGFTRFNGTFGAAPVPLSETNADIFRLAFGKYLTDTTTLTIAYSETEQETISNLLRPANQQITTETERQEYVVNGRHLMKFKDHHVLIEGLLRRSRFNTVSALNGDWIGAYSIGSTFYLNTKIGIGFGASGIFEDPVNVTDSVSYEFSVDWFFMPSVAAKLGYRVTDFEEIEFQQIDANELFISLTARM